MNTKLQLLCAAIDAVSQTVLPIVSGLLQIFEIYAFGSLLLTGLVVSVTFLIRSCRKKGS